MWEAYGLENEDFLWSCTNFMGGIGGHQQAVCGAVSASAVCLGLRHRHPLDDEEGTEQARQDARQKAGELVQSFTEKFGTIICRDLVGIDFSDPEAASRFRESGMGKEKCERYVQFAVEKLYELDDK